MSSAKWKSSFVSFGIVSIVVLVHWLVLDSYHLVFQNLISVLQSVFHNTFTRQFFVGMMFWISMYIGIIGSSYLGNRIAKFRLSAVTLAMTGSILVLLQLFWCLFSLETISKFSSYPQLFQLTFSNLKLAAMFGIAVIINSILIGAFLKFRAVSPRYLYPIMDDLFDVETEEITPFQHLYLSWWFSGVSVVPPVSIVLVLSLQSISRIEAPIFAIFGCLFLAVAIIPGALGSILFVKFLSFVRKLTRPGYFQQISFDQS